MPLSSEGLGLHGDLCVIKKWGEEKSLPCPYLSPTVRIFFCVSRDPKSTLHSKSGRRDISSGLPLYREGPYLLSCQNWKVTWNEPNLPQCLSSEMCNCNPLKHPFLCFADEYSFWSSCSLLRPSGRPALCMVASAVLNFRGPCMGNVIPGPEVLKV